MTDTIEQMEQLLREGYVLKLCSMGAPVMLEVHRYDRTDDLEFDCDSLEEAITATVNYLENESEEEDE
jgi:hypothetical protein